MSAGKGFWTNLRRSDPNTHKLAIQYQRSLRRLTKAELDLGFLRKCKESEVYPKFVRWRNINQLRRKKKQHRFHKLLLNEAINEKNANISNLQKVNSQLKAEIFGNITWMKAKLIIFSTNRLLYREKNKISQRHAKKFQRLMDMKTAADKLENNPNEVIVNLSGQKLTPEQTEVLILGLRHGLATRPNSLEMMAVSEDIYDQLDKKNIWKEGLFVKDKVKNSLRSFTYNCLDLDLKEYFVDRKRIRILADMTKTLSILKPDKGNGIVVLKRSDYVTSLKSIFENKTKFTRLTNDPTFTRLNTLQNYLLTLRNRNEISESEFNFMRLKAASLGRAAYQKHTNNFLIFRLFDQSLIPLLHCIIMLENFSRRY